MTAFQSPQNLRVSPVGWLLSFLEWADYLFPYSFISFIYLFSRLLWLAFAVTFSLCERVCVCLVPGSCWVCVLSLSLMSTRSSHCPYLKWPETHQQINIQAPPAHSAPWLGRVVYERSVSRWDTFNIFLNSLESGHPCSPVVPVTCQKQ